MTGQDNATGCSILEAAKAAGISKNTAKYRLRKAPEGVTSKGPDGKILVSAAGVQWLMESEKNHHEPPVEEPPVPDESPETTGKTTRKPVQNQTERTTGSSNTGSNREAELLVELLQATNREQAELLRAKDAQIDRLLAQLEATTQALQTAQEQSSAAMALHAGTMQKSLLEAAEPPSSMETVFPTGSSPKHWWQKLWE